jgi:hypothetical protein
MLRVYTFLGPMMRMLALWNKMMKVEAEWGGMTASALSHGGAGEEEEEGRKEGRVTCTNL